MQIIVMDRSGDTRHDFDVSNVEEVNEAMERFNELICQGKFASVPSGDGHSGRSIREFDPTAEKIVFRNQFIGG
jgi:hypothetical protein